MLMRLSSVAVVLGVTSILTGSFSGALAASSSEAAGPAAVPLNLSLSPGQIETLRNPYVDTGALNGAAEVPEPSVLGHDSLLDWRQAYDPRTHEPSYVNLRGETYAPGIMGDSATQLATGLAVLVLPFDRAGLDLVQNNGGKIVDQASTFGEKFGGNLAGKVVGAGYILMAILDENNQVKNFWVTLFQASVATKIVTDWTKGAFARSLPSASRNPYAQTWNSNPAAQDLPSGHAATSAAIATVVAEEFKEYPWVGWLSYFISGMTSYGRVRQNQHWPSAVFLGWGLGHGTAMAVIHRDETRSRWYITPVAARDFVGVQAILIQKQPPRPCPTEGPHRVSFEQCLRRGFRPKLNLFGR
jgi:membrane-associated phospholipid phosphatase